MNAIDGKALAAEIRNQLPPRIKRLPRPPGLAVVLIGNNQASELYVKLKQRAAEKIGILFTLNRQPKTAILSSVLNIIDAWNHDPEIDAILVQLPLPKPLKEQAVIEKIDSEKDVDGFHPLNTARYLTGERTDPPSLVEGILHLITSTAVEVHGLQATVVARPSIFTRCLEHGLVSRGVRVTTVRPNGLHHNETIQSQVVIVAAGRPGLIMGEDIQKDAIVIDVGINTLPNGAVVGDVDPETVAPVAGWLSPVPGGVGPMTIAMLLENVVRLAERNQA